MVRFEEDTNIHGRAYLLKLMDTEDTPSILAVRAGLLSEASAVTSVLDGKIFLLEPLALVESGEGLLGGCDQVLVRLLLTIVGDLVQLLIELLELSSLGHSLTQHEERRLVGLVALAEQKLETIVDEGQVEEKAVASQAVASVADDLDTTLRVVSVQTSQDFVVRKAVLLADLDTLRGPCADQLVLVFIVADGDGLVDVVANRLCLLEQSNVLLLGSFFLLLHVVLQLFLLLEQIIGVALSLLDLSNLLLHRVDLCANLRGGIVSCAEPKRQYILVDDGYGA